MFEKTRGELVVRNYGWISKLIRRKQSFFISINKAVIVGGCLQVGNRLYSYLAEDRMNRPLMITFLDGLPRHTAEHETVSQAGFVEKNLPEFHCWTGCSNFCTCANRKKAG
jgi:hypothetical protein